MEIGEDSLIFHHNLYKNVLFQVDNSFRSAASFLDSIQLPDSRAPYRIELSLYEIPVNLDLDQIKDLNEIQSFKVAHYNEDIN